MAIQVERFGGEELWYFSSTASLLYSGQMHLPATLLWQVEKKSLKVTVWPHTGRKHGRALCSLLWRVRVYHEPVLDFSIASVDLATGLFYSRH